MQYFIPISISMTLNVMKYQMEVIKDSQPILGYEINGEKSDIGDGVHLRLIVKTQFG